MSRAGKGRGEDGALDTLSDGVMDLRMRDWYWPRGESMVEDSVERGRKKTGPGIKGTAAGAADVGRSTTASASASAFWPVPYSDGLRLRDTTVGGLFISPVGWKLRPADPPDAVYL